MSNRDATPAIVLQENGEADHQTGRAPEALGQPAAKLPFEAGGGDNINPPRNQP